MTCGNKKVNVLVIGVQHGRDGLSSLLIGDRALIFSRVELLEIKFTGCCFAAPETEIVRGRSLVTGN